MSHPIFRFQFCLLFSRSMRASSTLFLHERYARICLNILTTDELEIASSLTSFSDCYRASLSHLALNLLNHYFRSDSVRTIRWMQRTDRSSLSQHLTASLNSLRAHKFIHIFDEFHWRFAFFHLESASLWRHSHFILESFISKYLSRTKLVSL
jgi:hypothetical protein